ncbi:type II toxin-antitoxin system VapC family toxin [Sphingomonas lenta]|uniref:Ribonuclease VapC n=1 Tax=Sphingomonas lenta TaxID=1141887 RepID=A0A2A2SD39_9SPHN|nr:PIN domain-containing protein [Sphingomonas lenta]PAX07166.1 VapC toxin family PIN domain ribonuclease [Sphingomonas lenta]
MILVDSSVWIDHFRRPNPVLDELLRAEKIMSHPFVIGELAMGSLADRMAVLARLRELIGSRVSSHDEVMTLVDAHGLHGLGLSYVDAHLLASTLLTQEARLWTRDKRLLAAAERLGVAAKPVN